MDHVTETSGFRSISDRALKFPAGIRANANTMPKPPTCVPGGIALLGLVGFARPIRTATCIVACAASIFASSAAVALPAKNVILMIADGRGFNSVKAAGYYTGTPAVYESFAHQYRM